jgi:glyoxylase-like metal-dependent hydrolase (beta-lactamase superfamily II)
MLSEDAFISRRMEEEGFVPGRPPLAAFDFPDSGIEVAGDIDLDLGGLTLRLLPVAGHSPGQLMVHVPERRALFVSDALGFHWPGRRFMPLFFTGAHAFRDTIDRIASLSPAILGLGHQGPLLGDLAAEAIEQAGRAHADLMEKVRGRSDDEVLADELFDEAYVAEFTLYSKTNIMNCCRLLVRRAAAEM